ncbi:MAG: hypothetical protein ABI688_04960 [Bacteroidota bacterium]
MKKNATPLVDDHLQSIKAMQEATTDDFFYTRLKARVLSRQTGDKRSSQVWAFPLKPVWVIGTLALLLAVNGFMLSQEFKTKKVTTETTAASLESFAESYDQTISSSY